MSATTLHTRIRMKVSNNIISSFNNLQIFYGQIIFRVSVRDYVKHRRRVTQSKGMELWVSAQEYNNSRCSKKEFTVSILLGLYIRLRTPIQCSLQVRFFLCEWMTGRVVDGKEKHQCCCLDKLWHYYREYKKLFIDKYIEGL